MSDRWYQDVALSRIGPDTAGLAAHLDARAAARAAGKTAAKQGVTAQRHREGAARAQVIRELAYWFVYPYRDSGRRGLLAEADASVAKIEARVTSGDRHEPGCGCGCEKPGRKIPETTGQVYAEADARGADPVWQWQEVTRSIVLPDYGQLITAIPDQPPGTCRDCRTGPLFKGNQCWYCNALGDLAIAEPAQPAREHSRALLLLIVILAGLLLWTALVLLLVLVST